MSRPIHYFFTRLAVDATQLHPDYKISSNVQINRLIELWMGAASKFYEHQTVDSPFQVCLRYSPRYRDLIKSFKFPKYAVLSELSAQEWALRNIPRDSCCTLTRVDADDSYAIDFMSYLDSVHPEGRLLILHKIVRHYDIATRRLSNELVHPCPMFATVAFSAFPELSFDPSKKRPDGNPVEEPAEMIGIVGNHGRYHEQDHIASPKCYALNRITGHNLANRTWGRVGRRNATPVETKLDPRFVGYHP